MWSHQTWPPCADDTMLINRALEQQRHHVDLSLKDSRFSFKTRKLSTQDKSKRMMVLVTSWLSCLFTSCCRFFTSPATASATHRRELRVTSATRRRVEIRFVASETTKSRSSLEVPPPPLPPLSTRTLLSQLRRKKSRKNWAKIDAFWQGAWGRFVENVAYWLSWRNSIFEIDAPLLSRIFT